MSTLKSEPRVCVPGARSLSLAAPLPPPRLSVGLTRVSPPQLRPREGRPRQRRGGAGGRRLECGGSGGGGGRRRQRQRQKLRAGVRVGAASPVKATAAVPRQARADSLFLAFCRWSGPVPHRQCPSAADQGFHSGQLPVLLISFQLPVALLLIGPASVPDPRIQSRERLSIDFSCQYLFMVLRGYRLII